MTRALGLHLAILGLLLALQFALPAYHHGNFARVMVLASFATGYNILFGYTGLLSLGHALFFAAGIYGAGIAAEHGGWPALPALAAGVAAGGALAGAVGLLALRTTGVAFLIVTLMFAQAGYLATLYWDSWTRGEEGFVLARAMRSVGPFDLADPSVRYMAAWTVFAVCLLGAYRLAVSPTGRVLVAIRENEERTRMLGYDTFRYKLLALALSGVYAGTAGGLYALLFGYVGATFATIQYSILPLLWVLVGGAGTVLGPFLGTLAMFYLVDLSSSRLMPWLASRLEAHLGVDATGLASAYMITVGMALLVLVLAAPRGVLGAVRSRAPGWLP